MVHAGEPAFFRAVYEDAFAHDVVLIEGVRSPITQRMTRSYRWIEGSKTLDLGIQPPYPAQAACRARIIHPDLSAEEFAEVWRKVPWWERALISVVAPAVGLWLRWFGSRLLLARRLSLDDLPRRDEILKLSPETAALDRAILHARDARLVERLGAQIDDPGSGLRRLAIVYGACHMRAVLRALTNRGYHVERGEWLTVFLIEATPPGGA